MRLPFRRKALCRAESPPIKFDRTGPARRVRCSLPDGHPADPASWEPRLHVSSEGHRFATERRVRT